MITSDHDRETAAPQGSSAAPLLSVKGLTVRLDKNMDRKFAVSDVNFDLISEEILCIVGESGSGKSVTANAILGLLPRTLKVESGQIIFRGDDLLKFDSDKLREVRGKNISMIFQDPLSALNPLLTVGFQIEEAMRVHGFGTPKSRKERTLNLLKEVGLSNPTVIQKQYPFRLSGGQRQRVMIAMALALEPVILIADEPTTALDVTTQAQILKLIKDIQRRKRMGVIFITHDFGVVAEIADRVVVMRGGKILEQGAASDILSDPKHEYTKELLNSIPSFNSSTSAPKPTSPVVLEVSNLTKSYFIPGSFFSAERHVPAVTGVSFKLLHGQTLGLIGESGSGKSTLGRLITRLAKSDGGSIYFEGRDIAAISDASFRPLRPKIQMVFQDPFSSLNPRHTVGYSLTAGPIAGGTRPEDARRKALALLVRVGLSHEAFGRYPHEFSGGQRQRVGIARALMLEPTLLVADEAVSALDVTIQAQILELLREIQHETKISMVFITHDLRMASQVCDDLIVMKAGTIVESGSCSQIFSAPQDKYTRALVASIPGNKNSISKNKEGLNV
ncbi:MULTISPECIES: ABC transporter ATP-binding protein [Rhizobium/Agrobacterium group]